MFHNGLQFEPFSSSTAHMGKTVLVLGGARSGKSRFAQQVAESLPGPRAFIATCPVLDEELAVRIEQHRMARRGKGWDTIEEPLALDDALGRVADYRVILIDCLTLWVNNVLHQAAGQGARTTESEMVAYCRGLQKTCSQIEGTVIIVSNEVGWGLVPPDPLSRLYRDLVGRCNQEISGWVETVVLLLAGIPLYLKNGA